jgi:hypothetical protein
MPPPSFNITISPPLARFEPSTSESVVKCSTNFATAAAHRFKELVTNLKIEFSHAKNNHLLKVCCDVTGGSILKTFFLRHWHSGQISLAVCPIPFFSRV